MCLKKHQKEAPKKTALKKQLNSRYLREELTGMSKDTLEVEMCKHGLELDRRKTKDTLVKQAVSFLKVVLYGCRHYRLNMDLPKSLKKRGNVLDEYVLVTTYAQPVGL